MKRAPSKPLKVYPRSIDERFKTMKAELDNHDAVVAKHAPTILSLSEKALIAVQTLMEADRQAKAEAQDTSTLFGGDAPSLEDAELAIHVVRDTARAACGLIE